MIVLLARIVAVALSLCVAVCGSRARADIPPEWLGSPVTAVRVVGDEAARIRPDALGIAAGTRLTRGLLRDLLERITLDSRWSDVQIDGLHDGEGVTLLVQLVPRLIVHRVDLVGVRALERRELLRIIGLREQAEIDRARFPELIIALRDAYAEHGYYEAAVQVVLRDTDDPARKVVRIEVAEGAPTTISSVRFRGEALPRRRGVRRLLGVGVGDPADLTRIQEGLDKTELLLRRSGYYAAELGAPTLERHGRKARVVIQSHVGPPFEVRFWDSGPISHSDLFAALALDQERFTGDASLRGIEQKLSELYRRYGYRDVQVQASARTELREHVTEQTHTLIREEVRVVDVRIRTGDQLVIEAITFPGARHYDTEFLREQVYSYLEEALPGSAVREPVDSELADRLGFGGSARRRTRAVAKPILLDPHRLFHAPTYAAAIDHIRELYRSDGFLDVEVGDVTLTGLPEPSHAVAAIPVVEGPRTFLYDVRVEGNQELASRSLIRAAGLSREAPFSYLKLEEARLRMIAACQEEGYFFAKVEPRMRRSADGTRAEVTFVVDEGYPVRIGAVEVRGAERSSKAMILDRVSLAPGDLYRPSLARQAQDALLALDVFSSVTVAPDEPTLPARVKTVVITVTERKTQWLGWSAGFSTGEGVRGGLEYGYRNLFGSAVHASFRGQLGYQLVFLDQQIEERYKSLSPDQRAEYQAILSFGVPYVPHLPKVRIGLDVSALADIQRDFRMQKESTVASLIYRPRRPLTFTLAEELEFSDFRLFQQNLDNIGLLTVNDLVPEGKNTLASTQLTAAWDHRDRAFNAHRGFLVSATSEWARTLQDRQRTVMTVDGVETVVFKSNMLRFTASFAFYVPLGPKVTFASQTRYGRVVHLVADSQSYPNRRFYLGGTNFRGYYQNQMVPEDLKKNEAVLMKGIISRGAETFVASQNELRFPLIGELYGAVFSDIGNLWADVTKLDLRKLQVVGGLGLRLQTPVASLAFDYGVRAIATSPFRMTGAFQFAFQTF